MVKLIIGLVIGANLGILVMALAVAASRSDKIIEDESDKQE